jgi:hypothetical protein
MRSARRVAGNRRTCRVPCEMCRCVRGVSDRAGSRPVSRWRHSRYGLPPSPTASAPRSGHGSRRGSYISPLNTWPARPTCQRFTVALTSDGVGLGAGVGRYSFTV